MTYAQKSIAAEAYKQMNEFYGQAGDAAEQGFVAGIDFSLQNLQQTDCYTALDLLQQMLNEVNEAYPNNTEPYYAYKEVEKYNLSNVIQLIKERQANAV